jgi:hypothetical protein
MSEDGVSVFGVLLQRINRFDRGQDEQFDSARFCLALHIIHHRQSAVCACANHEPAAFPRDFFLNRKRPVTEFISELF